MAISLSPAVTVTERDLTLVAVAASVSGAGFAGGFQWGPVMQPVTIESQNKLVTRFGKPNSDTFISFFSAANFLDYSTNLKVVRNVGVEAFNASSDDEQVRETFDGDAVEVEFVLNTTFSASPTNITVIVDGTVQTGGGVDYTASFVTDTLTITFEAGSTPATGTDNIVVFANASLIKNEDHFEGLATLDADFYGKYPGTLANGLKIIAADSVSYDSLSAADKAIFDGAPESQEIHIAVIDVNGRFSTANSVLEVYQYLSKTVGSTKSDGTTNYYKNVINDQSRYIWSNGTLAQVTDGVVTLGGGYSDDTLTDAEKILAFDLFSDGDTIDLGLIIAGEASEAVIETLISLAENRADCVVCLSPERADVVNNPGDEVTDTVAFRDTLPSTSYAFLDGNWKYQYDRYNDVNRWVPMCGDTAGLMARTDQTNDPWWSPAGLNRGQVKNVIKLAYNPTKTQRDTLYKSGINSIVAFPGEGTVLWGDKTLLSRPSAFDRINVRRLFIVLEKTISTAARYSLFEFNDEFTRAQFRNLVEPFLRDVQGRRGIARFQVVANEENNTAQVINSNSFVGDIFIDPARSINVINLNFIATSSGVDFEEIETAV